MNQYCDIIQLLFGDFNKNSDFNNYCKKNYILNFVDIFCSKDKIYSPFVDSFFSNKKLDLSFNQNLYNNKSLFYLLIYSDYFISDPFNHSFNDYCKIHSNHLFIVDNFINFSNSFSNDVKNDDEFKLDFQILDNFFDQVERLYNIANMLFKIFRFIFYIIVFKSNLFLKKNYEFIFDKLIVFTMFLNDYLNNTAYQFNNGYNYFQLIYKKLHYSIDLFITSLHFDDFLFSNTYDAIFLINFSLSFHYFYIFKIDYKFIKPLSKQIVVNPDFIFIPISRPYDLCSALKCNIADLKSFLSIGINYIEKGKINISSLDSDLLEKKFNDIFRSVAKWSDFFNEYIYNYIYGSYKTTIDYLHFNIDTTRRLNSDLMITKLFINNISICNFLIDNYIILKDKSKFISINNVLNFNCLSFITNNFTINKSNTHLYFIYNDITCNYSFDILFNYFSYFFKIDFFDKFDSMEQQFLFNLFPYITLYDLNDHTKFISRKIYLDFLDFNFSDFDFSEFIYNVTPLNNFDITKNKNFFISLFDISYNLIYFSLISRDKYYKLYNSIVTTINSSNHVNKFNNNDLSLAEKNELSFIENLHFFYFLHIFITVYIFNNTKQFIFIKNYSIFNCACLFNFCFAFFLRYFTFFDDSVINLNMDISMDLLIFVTDKRFYDNRNHTFNCYYDGDFKYCLSYFLKKYNDAIQIKFDINHINIDNKYIDDIIKNIKKYINDKINDKINFNLKLNFNGNDSDDVINNTQFQHIKNVENNFKIISDNFLNDDDNSDKKLLDFDDYIILFKIYE